ncbi:hypothetical protein ppKF707_3318 [Metapseudomonas furukawaii]|uniref:Uncharacterized protein n=1 Tax=Metapseudomonas furukawaii TaxID=1149133 RepID=A0AAD1BWR3_METFU|nr:hypothetical protein ppKF707_3318 [Pseudomonas furukawaii]BAU71928.1 hypothetical protein KF707C_2400 [Pseudomonas furukawaii]
MPGPLRRPGKSGSPVPLSGPGPPKNRACGFHRTRLKPT